MIQLHSNQTELTVSECYHNFTSSFIYIVINLSGASGYRSCFPFKICITKELKFRLENEVSSYSICVFRIKYNLCRNLKNDPRHARNENGFSVSLTSSAGETYGFLRVFGKNLEEKYFLKSKDNGSPNGSNTTQIGCSLVP